MKELKRDLLTTKYTKVFCEEEEVQKFGAPHHFEVRTSGGDRLCASKECAYESCPFSAEDRERKCSSYVEGHLNQDVLCEIHFQEGPIKECGVNGVCNEDLINMVLERLEHR